VTPLDAPREMTTRLDRVARRARAVTLLDASSVVAGMTAVIAAALIWRGASGPAALVWGGAAGSVAAAFFIRHTRHRWTRHEAARSIERHAPACHNVIVTAEELTSYPERAQPWIRARVLSDASRMLRDIPPAQVVSLRRAAATCLLAASVCVALLINGPQRATVAVREVGARFTDRATMPVEPMRIVVRLEPPAYTRQPVQSLDNPDRIEAIDGSRVHLTITGRGGRWQVRYGSRQLASTQVSGVTSANLQLTESGYFAVEPAEQAEGTARRLLPVIVTPDRAPVIRVEKPGRDLLLPDSRPTVPIVASAHDDLGLNSLELRYTRVSGTGEQFEFLEGTVPLQISRGSERAWTAQAQLALSTLKLEPGDSIVYRVVGRDRRPGDAGLASSDTFFVEIAGPGQVALAGFELPPDRERYALSQQMIVLKLQRLRARESSLTRETLEQETEALAAEQRAVRANFIFLMGGHVEDEEEEAEQSSEIQEGRLENTARREISAAIGHMGRAEQGLVAVNTGAAQPPAVAAVDALQRAFGRNRYILRTLAVRSRIDPSRRLTGELKSAGDWGRPLEPATLDRETREVRALLAALLELAPAVRGPQSPPPPAVLTRLAEDALRIDASSPEWQATSKRLLQVRDLFAAAGSRARAIELYAEAVGVVNAHVRRSSMTLDPPRNKFGLLQGAWAAEMGGR
jgi:hypothetical protein